MTFPFGTTRSIFAIFPARIFSHSFTEYRYRLAALFFTNLLDFFIKLGYVRKFDSTVLPSSRLFLTRRSPVADCRGKLRLRTEVAEWDRHQVADLWRRTRRRSSENGSIQLSGCENGPIVGVFFN